MEKYLFSATAVRNLGQQPFQIECVESSLLTASQNLTQTGYELISVSQIGIVPSDTPEGIKKIRRIINFKATASHDKNRA